MSDAPPLATPEGIAAWDTLTSQLAGVAEEWLHGVVVRGPVVGQKVVRDAVHGYQVLQPWEVEIVDSPLMQRLRGIHQTALAYQVYPSANHTRFEHSLGAAFMAGEVVRAMRETSDRDLFGEDQQLKLRLAALLHDVGHCIFSHLSESVIASRFDELFHSLRSERFFGGRAAGEILSYALVTCEPVRKYLNGVLAAHNRPIDVEEAIRFCVGQPSDSTTTYLADVITGPLDVDKLDYIKRDTHFTGIRADIDTQHIIRSMRVFKDGSLWGLGAQLSFASGVEQLHFARTMLFPAMYFHQKVRALECDVKGSSKPSQDTPIICLCRGSFERSAIGFEQLNLDFGD